MAIFSYQCLEAASLVSDALVLAVSSYSHVCDHVISCITDTTCFSIYTDASTTVVTHKCKAETTSGAEGSETEVEDEIDFEVSADDDDGGICIKVKYEQEIEDEAADTEKRQRLVTKFVFNNLLNTAKKKDLPMKHRMDGCVQGRRHNLSVV
jgi:hypothetical protein